MLGFNSGAIRKEMKEMWKKMIISDWNLYQPHNLSTSGKTDKELESLLKLGKVHQWFCSNKLALSKDKTEYMIIGSRRRINNITDDPTTGVGDDSVNRVKQSKTLGIVTDDKLLWRDHIDHMITKVSKALGMLRHMKPLHWIKTVELFETYSI